MKKKIINHRPTMKDVAEAAGVSWITVSRALTKPDLVSKKTQQKIQLAIDSLSYQPNQAAQSLVSGKSKTIIVIVPSISNNLYAKTVQGIQDELIPAGYQILLGNNSFSINEEEALIKTFLRHAPDGIILTSPVHTPKLRSILLSFKIPIIETWSLPETPINMAVGYSDKQASEMLANYLLKKGYRNFAYITRPLKDYYFANARWKAFYDSVKQYNEPIILEKPGSIEASIEAVKMILGMDKKIDCIVCGSSLFSIGVIWYLNKLHISVPDEISVAGIGNIELAPYLNPPLTVISTEPYLIGKTCGKLMLDKLSNKNKLKKIINLGVKLIVRDST